MFTSVCFCVASEPRLLSSSQSCAPCSCACLPKLTLFPIRQFFLVHLACGAAPALKRVVPFKLADIGEAIAEVELVEWCAHPFSGYDVSHAATLARPLMATAFHFLPLIGTYGRCLLLLATDDS